MLHKHKLCGGRWVFGELFDIGNNDDNNYNDALYEVKRVEFYFTHRQLN